MRSVPRFVVAVTAAFTALLAAYSFVVPLNEAPDEPSHVDLTAHLARGGRYPDYDERRVGAAALELCKTRSARPRRCPWREPRVDLPERQLHPSERAPAKSSSATFDETGGDVPVGAISEIAQHPPLYYGVTGAALRVARWVTPGSWSFAQEVALLRLFNVALVMWLPALAWWAAVQLGLSGSTPLVASALPLASPQLLHIGSSVNNDNLLMVLGAAAVGLLARVVRGDASRRTALALGAVVSGAILTKVLGLAFVPAIALAYVVGVTGRRRVVSGAIALGVVTAASGWWFVRNLIQTGELAPTAADLRLTEALRPPGFSAELSDFLRLFVPDFAQRLWGEFGWFSAAIPHSVAYGATLALLALVVLGVALAQQNRQRLLVLLSVVAILFGFVVQHAWTLYARTGRPSFIQGRYVFAGLAALAVAAAIGAVRLLGRWAVPAAVASAGAMTALAWRAMAKEYWTDGAPLDDLRAALAWSPWPSWVVAIGGVVTVLACGWLAFEAVRETRQS